MTHRTDKSDLSRKSHPHHNNDSGPFPKGLPQHTAKTAEAFPQGSEAVPLRHSHEIFSHANGHHLNKPHMHLMVPGNQSDPAKILLRDPKRHTIDLQRNLRIPLCFRIPSSVRPSSSLLVICLLQTSSSVSRLIFNPSSPARAKSLICSFSKAHHL